MSLFVIYFGTNRRYENIAHHEIIMGKRYKELLEDIFEKKILADDFSLYLHRPTATDRSLAPAGHDCWYVLSPVPHLGGNVDWEAVGQRYRDRIMQYLEERYLPDLSKHIVTERRIDPRYFETTLNSYLGSAVRPRTGSDAVGLHAAAQREPGHPATCTSAAPAPSRAPASRVSWPAARSWRT